MRLSNGDQPGSMFLRTAIIVRPDIAAIRRFTPTGVGTIASDIVSNRQKAVHPHGRGDNENSVRFHGVSSGSPPRAWGQCVRRRHRRHHRRFTPTGVGTIEFERNCYYYNAVHPHRRGDNAVFAYFTWAQVGSPPRAWGQYTGVGLPDFDIRFTPTGVGTITRLRKSRDISTVHPHGRGDNRNSDRYYDLADGSPPRAWGQWR